MRERLGSLFVLWPAKYRVGGELAGELGDLDSRSSPTTWHKATWQPELQLSHFQTPAATAAGVQTQWVSRHKSIQQPINSSAWVRGYLLPSSGPGTSSYSNIIENSLYAHWEKSLSPIHPWEDTSGFFLSSLSPPWFVPQEKSSNWLSRTCYLSSASY